MRLIHAEVLKLVRRRGTMIWCLLLTVGSVIVTEIVLVVLACGERRDARPCRRDARTSSLHVFVIGAARHRRGDPHRRRGGDAGRVRRRVPRPRGHGPAAANALQRPVPGAVAVFMPMLAIAFGIAVRLCVRVRGWHRHAVGGRRRPLRGVPGGRHGRQHRRRTRPRCVRQLARRCRSADRVGGDRRAAPREHRRPGQRAQRDLRCGSGLAPA